MQPVARRVAHIFSQPAALASLRASTSRAAATSVIPRRQSAHADRYLTIHAFFTRQASSTSRSLLSKPTIPQRFPHTFHRHNSSTSTTPATPPPPEDPKREPCQNCPQQLPLAPRAAAPPKPPPGAPQDYAPFIRRLIHRSDLQHAATHRPTKADLLAAADSWWQRLRIRFKYFTIRGWRRFNTDDLSAFLSWFVVGNTIWILIGTTTFVSAVLFTLNSLSLQEYVARWISDYLTSAAGVTVIFESAIVPKWGASKISFRNVYVSRRPVDADPNAKKTKTATATPPNPTAYLAANVPVETYASPTRAPESENYTMYDINFDEVEVTLSLRRWLDGKGLVQQAKVKGVRGVIDRRSVWWDPSKRLEPADFRHPTATGDFELDDFVVEDFLVTVYQPGGQRPYNVSIFNAHFGPFRKRWLFYDMLSAEAMTGQYDNCLFSLHMPQKLGKAIHADGMVKRMARFRIDGLPIEHAQYASGNQGPMSWITSGKLDAVLDIKFPQHPDDESVDIMAIFDEIGRNVANITTQGSLPADVGESGDLGRINDAIAATEASSSALIPGQHRLARPPLRAPGRAEPVDQRRVTIDIDMRFRDLKAAVPVFTYDLSMTNNALIRPIVAFINANRTLVPIHCQVAADLPDFDGSWTLFETGLMTSISQQIYAALAYHVTSEAANSKRIRQVGYWGLQRGAAALLDALKTVVDPINGQATAAL